ncbi:hypothetical protein F4604DRAFT_1935295 [Suillus subluteus]|nr:hypothetical protein F4604DRAFT_1935295 [Suillus subluteus]
MFHSDKLHMFIFYNSVGRKQTHDSLSRRAAQAASSIWSIRGIPRSLHSIPPPTPSWTYGQRVDTTPAGKYWVAGESAGWKVYNTAKTDKVYVLDEPGTIQVKRTSTIISSPCTLTSLASTSWFNTPFPVGTNYPLIVSFACNQTAPSRFKDTIANLKNSQGFTVSVISEPFVGSANATAVDVPPGFDEWSISGLTKYACTFVIRYMRQQQGVQVQIKAPCVKASAFSMECELYKFVDITHSVAGEHNGMLILVRVKCIRLRKDMLSGTVVLTASTRK